jgi:hypothetical protein
VSDYAVRNLGACYDCGFSRCICEDEELPPLPGTLDARDATPEPPARLDPASILRNRRRTETYLATGDFTWPRHDSPTQPIERTSHGLTHP